MPESPDKRNLTENNAFEEAVGGFVHQWTPHSSLGIYSCSLMIFLVATIWATYSKKNRAKKKPMTPADLARVGFAAGPIPIYLMLPLAPFDPDLADVLLGEPFQLLIAAAIGVVWTFADIKKIIGR